MTDSANTALNLFVPYLRLHISMSEIEETANMALKDKTVPETDKAYYSAMCDYVHNSRVSLNTALGVVKLPEPPQRGFYRYTYYGRIRAESKDGAENR